MATGKQKQAFQSDVAKAVTFYEKSVKDAQQAVKEIKKTGSAADVKQAQGLLKQLIDLKPTIDTLAKATSPTATFKGPITQSLADTINVTRAAGTYGGAGYQPEIVYAREVSLPGLEKNRSDAEYIATGRSGISNTGKYYYNGKVVNNQSDWVNLINQAPNANQLVLNETGDVVYGTGDLGAGDLGGIGGVGGAGGIGGAGMGATGGGVGTAGTPTFPFNAPGNLLAKDVFKSTLSTIIGATEASKPWVDALYDVVSKSYKAGMDVENAINTSLLQAKDNPALKPFTDRFKGWYSIQDLRAAGKPVQVPTFAEFVVSQASLGDLFRNANLGDLATEEFTGEVLGTGKSVSTIGSAIANAFNRIDRAPQAIKDTLSRYYPTVDRTTLARTLLLGPKGVQELTDELAKYEVLAAAEQQGIAATGLKPITGGVTEERAAQFARAGGTYGSLLPKFAQVKLATPEIAKLSGISRRADIGQVGVEQAIIGGLAQPMEDIRLLGEEELGRFSGRAGRAETGLASQRRASRSAY